MLFKSIFHIWLRIESIEEEHRAFLKEAWEAGVHVGARGRDRQDVPRLRPCFVVGRLAAVTAQFRRTSSYSSFHRGCERQFSRVYQAKNVIVVRAASSATAIAPMRIVISRTAN
jgi:hypothetical protein